jgi:hypothetical protein
MARVSNIGARRAARREIDAGAPRGLPTAFFTNKFALTVAPAAGAIDAWRRHRYISVDVQFLPQTT